MLKKLNECFINCFNFLPINNVIASFVLIGADVKNRGLKAKEFKSNDKNYNNFEVLRIQIKYKIKKIG